MRWGFVLFLALIISSLPFFIVGFPDGHDAIFELVRVAEFRSSLVNGQFPPYWGANLYGGHGSPIFLFHPPLYLLVSVLFSVVTGSIASGIIVAMIAFTLVGIFGIKLVLQEALGRQRLECEAASRIAAYFLILNPYLLGDKFLRNANSEYAALCISPLAIYGLLILGRKRLVGGLILAAGLALTIMAHNITALVVTALISMAALFLYFPVKNISPWMVVIGGIALGLALAAFYWVPALYYLSMIRGDQMTTGRFDFRSQFQPLGYLFGYSKFFSTGLLVPYVILKSLRIVFDRDRKEFVNTRLLYFAFGCSLLFVFLQTRASMPIWETVPYMPFFEFPWRMMGPLAVVTSIVAGFTFAILWTGESRKSIIIREFLTLLLCTINAVPHLSATRALPNQIPAQLAIILKPETIRDAGLSATVSDEYLPRFADPSDWWSKRFKVGPVVRTLPEIEVKVLKDTGTKIILETNSPRPARLELKRWFFPGWRCTVNGKPHGLESNAMGSIDVLVPAGVSQIALELHPPLLRQVTLGLSLTSLLVWFCMLTVALRKK